MNAQEIKELEKYRFDLGLVDPIGTIYSKERLAMADLQEEKARADRGATLAREGYSSMLKTNII